MRYSEIIFLFSVHASLIAFKLLLKLNLAQNQMVEITTKEENNSSLFSRGDLVIIN